MILHGVCNEILQIKSKGFNNNQLKMRGHEEVNHESYEKEISFSYKNRLLLNLKAPYW